MSVTASITITQDTTITTSGKMVNIGNTVDGAVYLHMSDHEQCDRLADLLKAMAATLYYKEEHSHAIED